MDRRVLRLSPRTPRPTTTILLRISTRQALPCGTEVKSVRQGNVNLKDAFCIVKDGELPWWGCTSPPMSRAIFSTRTPAYPPSADAQAGDSRLFQGEVDGYSLIPLSLYFRSRVKVEVGLQGQEALRQAGAPPPGRQARDGPGHEVPGL